MDVGNAEVAQGKVVVRLVPLVLERLLAFVGAPDNVNCMAVHRLFCLTACPELKYQLASPKNGVFLMKYPMIFSGGECVRPYQRQAEFVDIMCYNLETEQRPAIIEPVRKFFAGYSRMLLDEVNTHAGNSWYGDLKTFIVDFSALGYEGGLRGPIPGIKRPKQIVVYADQHRQGRGELCLFLDEWQQWARTITAVINSCCEKLQHFIFTNDAFDKKNFDHDVTVSRQKLKVPIVFLEELNFDKILSKLLACRTVYVPIRDYEEACRTFPWPILRSYAAEQRLPLLKRLVLPVWKDIRNDDGRFRKKCVMPDITMGKANVSVVVHDARNSAVCDEHTRILIRILL